MHFNHVCVCLNVCFPVGQVASFVKGLPGCKEHAATFRTEVRATISNPNFVNHDSQTHSSHLLLLVGVSYDNANSKSNSILPLTFKHSHTRSVLELILCLCVSLQQMDGEAFLLLTQADIVKILSIKLGPALKIYNAILMLKNADEE